MRGQDEVTVEVGVDANGGAFGFGPAAVHVDNGATVRWEWTGNGGQHNVVSQDGAFESDLFTESGVHFERTFDEDGIYNYYCAPHQSLNMKGSVVVGSDFPTKSAGGVTPLNPEHMGVPFQAHFVGFATLLAMFASLVFTFFLLKYGESANTKGGNN
jgi:halocyanin-like protein